ncbi:hypothetical protein EEJ31_11355 [Cryobacterium tepidiphilum]|uniref:AbiEi antitoxin C-terminal domain-containing protein n=1 Tax=Cryobacterium tepidiphilum TaxID=2486026 RepID=A0A3M8L385_9MICO|nr:hypothetical protein EEJ31_11355 [Cryobacterium tepidiphilum]
MSGAFGADMRLRRLVDRGLLQRINRGQYVAAQEWSALGRDDRYRVRVLAAARSRTAAPPLSHESAAVLWGLPVLAGWPAEVHFVTERRSGGRSYPGVRVHAVGFDARDVTVREGVVLTTVERTVVDLAARLDVKSAVAVIDRALAVDRFRRVPAMTTKLQLLETWERMLPFRGSVRARVLIEFGSELADSPNESASRVNIALSGFPEPVLQKTFVIDGRRYDTDFYWEEFDAVGECDGDAKYFDPVLLGGRTTAEVVKAEKDREDAIRRRVAAFGRWDSAVAMSQYRLRERLLELGLPARRRRLLLPQSDLQRDPRVERRYAG